MRLRHRANARPVHHASARHQHSHLQVFLQRCHEAAQETRKANTCVSQKPAARGCCIKRACPPRSSSRACERRGAVAKPHRSSIPAPEPAPRCPELSRRLLPSLTASSSATTILILKPPRKGQPHAGRQRCETLSIISPPALLSLLTAEGLHHGPRSTAPAWPPLHGPCAATAPALGNPCHELVLYQQERWQWQNKKKKNNRSNTSRAYAGHGAATQHQGWGRLAVPLGPPLGAWVLAAGTFLLPRKSHDQAGDGKKIPAHWHGPC